MNKYPRRIKYAPGQRYFSFVIVSGAPTRVTKDGRSYTCWNCLCDCGKEFITTTKQVQRGIRRSCGCLSLRGRFQRKSPKEVVSKVKFDHYKNSAKSRGLPWDLTLDYFTELLFERCFYCRVDPCLLVKASIHSLKINGVDRMDSSLGYSMENCVSCCYVCNRAKGNMSVSDFFSWFKRLEVLYEGNRNI